jgi:uncharacterized membrane protein YkoI
MWHALTRFVVFKRLAIWFFILISFSTISVVYAAVRGGEQEQETENRILEEQSADGNAEQRTTITRRRASDLARERYEGRVLSVILDGNRWRVRIDSEGTVFNVFVNAGTGEVTR